MAELRKPPRVREISVEVETERGKKSRRKGVSLDDVVRAVVWQLKRDRDLSQDRMAKSLGLTQQNLARLLDEELHGTSLDVLSRICAALRETPLQFLRRHKRYDGDLDFVDDRVYDKFRVLLNVNDAKDLVAAMENAAEAGSFSVALQSAITLFDSNIGTERLKKQIMESDAYKNLLKHVNKLEREREST